MVPKEQQDIYDEKVQTLIQKIEHLIRIEKTIVNIFHVKPVLYFLRLILLLASSIFFGYVIALMVNIAVSLPK